MKASYYSGLFRRIASTELVKVSLLRFNETIRTLMLGQISVGLSESDSTLDRHALLESVRDGRQGCSWNLCVSVIGD